MDLYGKRGYDKSVTLYDCQNTFEKFVDLKPSLIRSITRHEPDSNKSSWPQNREMITFHTMQLQPHNFHVAQFTIQVRPFFFSFSPKRGQMRQNYIYILDTFHFIFTSCKKSCIKKKKLQITIK